MTPELLFFAILPDVGGGEMMLILLVVLMLFGGDQMPQMAKKLGKTISKFKKAANEVEREIKRAIDEVPDIPDVPNVRATIQQAVEDKPKPAPVVPHPTPAATPPTEATPPPSAA